MNFILNKIQEKKVNQFCLEDLQGDVTSNEQM